MAEGAQENMEEHILDGPVFLAKVPSRFKPENGSCECHSQPPAISQVLALQNQYKHRKVA